MLTDYSDLSLSTETTGLSEFLGESLLATRFCRELSAVLPAKATLAIQKIRQIEERIAEHHSDDGSQLHRRVFLRHIAEKWSLNQIASLSDESIQQLVTCFINGSMEPQPFVMSGAKGRVVFLQHLSRHEQDLTRSAIDALIESDVIVANEDVPRSITDIAVHSAVVRIDSSFYATPNSLAEAIVLQAFNEGKQVTRVFGHADASCEFRNEVCALQYRGIPVRVISPSKSVFEEELPSITRSQSPDVSNQSSDETIAVDVTANEFGGFPVASKVIYSSGSEVIASVASDLSDIVLIFPLFKKQYLGESLLSDEYRNKKNVVGKSLRILKLATSASSGRIIQGASKNDSIVTAFLPSVAIEALLPSLSDIVKEGKNPVFHVSSLGIDEQLLLRTDYNDVLKAAHTGFVLIASSSVQEAYYMAIFSYAVSLIAKLPVLHFVDGVQLVNQTAKTVTVSPESVMAGITSIGQKYSNSSRSVDYILESLSAAVFGRNYKSIEYEGVNEPKTAFISMGVSSAIVKEAVALLSDNGVSIGSLNIRVFRPWSADKLRKALPSSVNTLIIVDDAGAEPTSLFVSDITNAFSASSSAINILTVPHSTHSAPFDVKTLTDFVTGISHDLVAKKKVTEVIFWDVTADETHKAAESLSKYLAKYYKNVQVNPILISAQIEPQNCTHLRFGDADCLPSSQIKEADVIIVSNLKVSLSHNFASSLAKNGKVFLNVGAPVNDISKHLPSAIRRGLIEKNASIYALDVNKIARDFTIFYGTAVEYLIEILQLIFLKLSYSETDFAIHYARLIDRIKGTEVNPNVIQTKLGALHRALEQLQVILVSVNDDEPTQENRFMTAAMPTIPADSIPYSDTFTSQSMDPTLRLMKSHHVMWPLLFPSAFRLRKKVRPDIGDNFQVKVSQNFRLTPESYDRNVFHMELDITGTDLKYGIGDALGVFAENDPKEVNEFLKHFGIDGKSIAYIDFVSDGQQKTEVRTVEQLFINVLDIFGKPGKKFYQLLATRATEESEVAKLVKLLEFSGDLEEFSNTEMPTFADLLIMFPSCKFTVKELIRAIPFIKPRHYSIASSQRVHPNSVHLLVVLVEWTTNSGKQRYGQATRFLVNAKVGASLTVSVKPSVMKLPLKHTDPVIMAGLGTGMAPFRAFIEERWFWKQQGEQVGPMILYFGSRHRSMEYLYGEELEAYHHEGVLTHLRLAFSRDQKQKVYIQHKIEEDADILNQLMLQNQGAFYLCGPTWPVPDVASALVSSFSKTLCTQEAEQHLETLKSSERYILEVY